MEPSIWEMQQAAQRRVERMEQLSRHYTRTDDSTPYTHRSAASMRASRPTPYVSVLSNHNLPPQNQNLPPKMKKSPDLEQIFLLLLTIFLAKNGGSPALILALLYLSF